MAVFSLDLIMFKFLPQINEIMSKPNLSITKQAFIGLSALAIVMWLALFLPAWYLVIGKEGSIGLHL